MRHGKFTKTKEWLIEEYVIKNRSRKEIAKECGLTISGLKSLLIKFDIKKEELCISKDSLEDLVNRKYNVKEIADYFKCSCSVIYRNLAKYKLKIKADPIKNSQYDDSNDDLMISLYLDGISAFEISKQFGISHKTVHDHLIRNDIEIRSLSEAQWTYKNKSIPSEFNNYDDMYELYINQKLSKKELGKKFNCDPCVIDRILKKFNIPIRGTSESKIGLNTGESHPNWQGGITALHLRLREAFGVQLVPKVLKRDNYRCKICGKSNKLHVHHIKPFKEILQEILQENKNYKLPEDINSLYEIAVKDSRFLDLNNLITYCKDCHLYKIHKYSKKK